MLDNVALVVLEEMAPGSVEWYTWRDVLHLVDIACCCAILFPIVWSIRHLRQAAGADGKAEHNLMKLTLFRQFYIMVRVRWWKLECEWERVRECERKRESECGGERVRE